MLWMQQSTGAKEQTNALLNRRVFARLHKAGKLTKGESHHETST